MKILSRSEWAQIWSTTDPATVGRTLSVGEYVVLCCQEHRRRQQQYPGVDFSNARYVAHLEQCLRCGEQVPAEYLADVQPDELQFDAFAFPFLTKALGYPVSTL